MTHPLWKDLSSKIQTPLRYGVLLRDLTYYRIGGPAEAVLETGHSKDIQTALHFCKQHEMPITLLGAGSNVLAPDKGLSGLVVKIYQEDLDPVLEDQTLVVSAAVTDERFAEFAAQNGISGFEFACDIPGTIGGAVVQNASTNDGDTRTHLIDVTYLNEAGQVVTSPVEKLGLGYRTSYFKEHFGVILQARFAGNQREDVRAIQKKMEAIRALRKSKFPMERANCGSVFKRPKNDYAGRLIQEAGLGGFRVGDAEVSGKHRNFIVNHDNATAADVKAVVAHAIEEVYNQFGVMLERELIYLPENKGAVHRPFVEYCEKTKDKP